MIIIPFLKHEDTYSNFCTNMMTPSWAVHDTINKGVSRTHQSLIETINQPSYSSIKIVNPVFHKHPTLHYKICGNPLVAWKHYYMQHAFACIAVQCNCTTSGKYTNYHHKRKTTVFSHQMNSNWMYAVAYLLYHKKNVTVWLLASLNQQIYNKHGYLIEKCYFWAGTMYL